jgi:WhiB family redox-sensing transcriptional regulator
MNITVAAAEWIENASCRTHPEPDLWYPDNPGRSTEHFRAIKICRSCPVRDKCLEHALSNDERAGIWGGYGERRRRELRRTNYVNRNGSHQ